MHFYCENCKQIVQEKIEFVISNDGSADPVDRVCPICGDVLNAEPILEEISHGTLCKQCNMKQKDEIYDPYCSMECFNLD